MLCPHSQLFADKIEAGESGTAVAGAALSDHWKVIFNGNGYSADWPVEADKKGVWRIDSGVEAVAKLKDDKNIVCRAPRVRVAQPPTMYRARRPLTHQLGPNLNRAWAESQSCGSS